MSHKGKALSWQMKDGVLELALHHPAVQRNRHGDAGASWSSLSPRSSRRRGKRQRGDHLQRAGRRLFARAPICASFTPARCRCTPEERAAGVRAFLERIHAC